MKLKACVKKIKSAQNLTITKHVVIIKDKFNREVEIYLTRKALVLKVNYTLTMNQAEQRKQLVLNIFQRYMEKDYK